MIDTFGKYVFQNLYWNLIWGNKILSSIKKEECSRTNMEYFCEVWLFKYEFCSNSFTYILFNNSVVAGRYSALLVSHLIESI